MYPHTEFDRCFHKHVYIHTVNGHVYENKRQESATTKIHFASFIQEKMFLKNHSILRPDNCRNHWNNSTLIITIITLMIIIITIIIIILKIIIIFEITSYMDTKLSSRNGLP